MPKLLPLSAHWVSARDRCRTGGGSWLGGLCSAHSATGPFPLRHRHSPRMWPGRPRPHPGPHWACLPPAFLMTTLTAPRMHAHLLQPQLHTLMAGTCRDPGPEHTGFRWETPLRSLWGGDGPKAAVRFIQLICYQYKLSINHGCFMNGVVSRRLLPLLSGHRPGFRRCSSAHAPKGHGVAAVPSESPLPSV